MTDTPKKLKQLIDDLGQIRAEHAELVLRENAVKRELDKLDPGAYEGDLFRVVATDYKSKRLDMKAVRAKLSRQFIQANTKTTPARRYTVGARQGVEYSIDANIVVELEEEDA